MVVRLKLRTIATAVSSLYLRDSAAVGASSRICCVFGSGIPLRRCLGEQEAEEGEEGGVAKLLHPVPPILPPS